MVNDHAMQTYTGRMLDIFGYDDHILENLSLVDIAWGLFNAPRFGGQCRDRRWKVGHHSILVCQIGVALYPDESDDFRLACLLHDGSEAYMGDMVKPHKEHPMMAGFRLVETRLQGLIYQNYLRDPDSVNWDTLKKCDDLALHFEAATYMKNPEWVDKDKAQHVESMEIHSHPRDSDYLLYLKILDMYVTEEQLTRA